VRDWAGVSSIDLTAFVIHLQDFSSSWDIRATPTFFFLKNGRQVDKLVGANKRDLEKKVHAIVSSSSSIVPDLESDHL
jgi:thioredoxin 1